MPVKKSSIKALSVAKRRAAENRRWKARLSVATKALAKAPAAEATTALKKVQSLVDRSVKHDLMHRNRAARLKSRLTRLVSAKG